MAKRMNQPNNKARIEDQDGWTLHNCPTVPASPPSGSTAECSEKGRRNILIMMAATHLKHASHVLSAGPKLESAPQRSHWKVCFSDRGVNRFACSGNDRGPSEGDEGHSSIYDHDNLDDVPAVHKYSHVRMRVDVAQYLSRACPNSAAAKWFQVYFVQTAHCD